MAFIAPPESVDASQASQRAWFMRSPGRELLALENQILAEMLKGQFGHFLLQVGALGHQEVLSSASGVRTKVCVLSVDIGLVSGVKTIVGDPVTLPVSADSVDLVLLPHTLDFSRNPHQILREVERILIPEGRVIIFGFSPWSFWGLWRLFKRRSKAVPWCGQFISPQRMRDWLCLLGLDIHSCEGLMFRPPLARERVMQQMQMMERIGGRFWPLFSGAYAIQAVKRVSKLTPIKPNWKLRSKRVEGRVIEPAARSWKSGRTG